MARIHCVTAQEGPEQSVDLLFPISFFKGWVPVRVVAKAIGVEAEVVKANATAPGAQKDFA